MKLLQLMILLEMMLEVVIGVVYMEVDMERHSIYILPIVLHSI